MELVNPCENHRQVNQEIHILIRTPYSDGLNDCQLAWHSRCLGWCHVAAPQGLVQLVPLEAPQKQPTHVTWRRWYDSTAPLGCSFHSYWQAIMHHFVSLYACLCVTNLQPPNIVRQKYSATYRPPTTTSLLLLLHEQRGQKVHALSFPKRINFLSPNSHKTLFFILRHNIHITFRCKLLPCVSFHAINEAPVPFCPCY